MSVSLLDVLEDDDYDVLHNADDALWLLSKRNEFEELLESAQELIDNEEIENEDDN